MSTAPPSWQRTEEIGTKVYERKLTAQLTKALERDARAQECRKYHTGPPCPGKVCRCKRQAERQRFRRVEQVSAEHCAGRVALAGGGILTTHPPPIATKYAGNRSSYHLHHLDVHAV